MQATMAPPPTLPLRRFRRADRLHKLAVSLFIGDQYARARRAEFISLLYRNPSLTEADVRASDRALRGLEGR